MCVRDWRLYGCVNCSECRRVEAVCLLRDRNCLLEKRNQRWSAGGCGCVV